MSRPCCYALGIMTGALVGTAVTAAFNLYHYHSLINPN